MSNDGQHFLIVQAFDPDDDTDLFDIEHPEGCPTYVTYGVDGQEIIGESCGLAYHIDANGIDGYFIHADDSTSQEWGAQRVPEGRHAIEAWSKQRRYAEGIEWDGGLRLVEFEEGWS